MSDSGINSAQLHSATKKDGVTQITYRKTFSNLGDPGDITIPEDELVSVIWAIGKMAEVRHRVKEPSFHHTYTRKHTQIGKFQRRNYSLTLSFNYRFREQGQSQHVLRTDLEQGGHKHTVVY